MVRVEEHLAVSRLELSKSAAQTHAAQARKVSWVALGMKTIREHASDMCTCEVGVLALKSSNVDESCGA